MPVISLLTDFGTRDGFVGIVQGVILGIAPEVSIVDISHAVPPQQIEAGGLILRRAYRFFPAGTVHMYVVDPGVGTQRRGLAALIGDYFFVGPDNGLLTPILAEAELAGQSIQIVQLTNSHYWRSEVSSTFHGRDIFAPVAAQLALGTSITDLGPALRDPIRIKFAQPRKTSTGWLAHVTSIDTFGNIKTDLRSNDIPGSKALTLEIRNAEVPGLVGTFGERPPGQLIALIDSDDHLEIAEVNGSAAARLGAEVGDEVRVILSE